MIEITNEARMRREKRVHYNPVYKDTATFLKTSEETGGEYTLIDIEVGPGGGNAPHYHKTYDEHFEVVEGQLEVLVGNETCVLRAGQIAVAPRNTLHSFRNATGEPARFLVEFRPGQTGFEKAMAAGYGLARDGFTRPDGTPKSLYNMALLLEWSEVRVPGVFTVIEPLMRLLAKRARRKGIDRELEQRYWK